MPRPGARESVDLSANYLGFVLASYGLSALVLAVMTAVVVLRYRRTRRRLDALEASGAPRRRKAMSQHPGAAAAHSGDAVRRKTGSQA